MALATAARAAGGGVARGLRRCDRNVLVVVDGAPRVDHPGRDDLGAPHLQLRAEALAVEDAIALEEDHVFRQVPPPRRDVREVGVALLALVLDPRPPLARPAAAQW